MNHVIWDKKLITPSKIVCIGRNYVEHIHELGNTIPDEMVVFNKPNSAIGQSLLSCHKETLHFETELCFLVQQGDFVAAAIGLDLTKRALQSTLKQKGLPWERAKAFNGAAVFTEFTSIAADAIPTLSFVLTLDGQIRQTANTELMMYKPDVIKQSLTDFMDLQDNDIVMTGTPKGVGKVNAGSEFTVQLFAHQQRLIKHTWHAI
ncbi:MAG: fumarylacetoacetate hydrolase family protein [Halioglobus sp.]|nr:fumarylacetoacetate hydrolase family protein [Halioglobus sp.]